MKLLQKWVDENLTYLGNLIWVSLSFTAGIVLILTIIFIGLM